MQNIKFETIIDRDIDFVFNNILREDIFKMWAKVFTPGSTYVGIIKQSGSINFIDDAKNGVGGFVSDLKENELIEFTLFYQINDGKPQNFEEAIIESFVFEELDNNKTQVSVYFDLPESFIEPLSKMWNQGIKEIKTVLENL